MSQMVGPQGHVCLGSQHTHREFAIAADKINVQRRFDHVRHRGTVCCGFTETVLASRCGPTSAAYHQEIASGLPTFHFCGGLKHSQRVLP